MTASKKARLRLILQVYQPKAKALEWFSYELEIPEQLNQAAVLERCLAPALAGVVHAAQNHEPVCAVPPRLLS